MEFWILKKTLPITLAFSLWLKLESGYSKQGAGGIHCICKFRSKWRGMQGFFEYEPLPFNRATLAIELAMPRGIDQSAIPLLISIMTFLVRGLAQEKLMRVSFLVKKGLSLAPNYFIKSIPWRFNREARERRKSVFLFVWSMDIESFHVTYILKFVFCFYCITWVKGCAFLLQNIGRLEILFKCNINPRYSNQGSDRTTPCWGSSKFTFIAESIIALHQCTVLVPAASTTTTGGKEWDSMKEDRFPLLLAFWQKTYLRVSRDWWGIGWNGSASTVILAHCSFCLYLIRWGVSSSLWDVWDVIAWIFLLWINSFDSEWFTTGSTSETTGGKWFRSFRISFSLSSDQREKSEWSLDREHERCNRREDKTSPSEKLVCLSSERSDSSRSG